MTAWPAICTAIALATLLILIIRFKMQAFVALLVVSIGLGVASGMSPERVLGSVGRGVGDILAGVAILLALGSMLGRMLDVSGAAEVIARTLVNTFGSARASVAILAAAYLIGIPILFNVGFLLLIPIMWRLQRETGKSLLYFVLPLSFALGTTHSLVPPHPGVVGVVGNLAPAEIRAQVMIETIIFGTLMGIPIVLVGWFGPGRWWAKRAMVEPPPHLAGTTDEPSNNSELNTQNSKLDKRPAFALCVLIVTMPLLLSLLGFGVNLLGDLQMLPPAIAQAPVASADVPGWLQFLAHPPRNWFLFLGHPTMALLVPTALAFILLGLRRGLGGEDLAKIANRALVDVGGMVFLFGAAGGFKQVIEDSGAGQYIAEQMLQLPLTPVALAYVVAALVRIALGSATASALLASGLLAPLALQLPGYETLLVLAVANGVTFMTQPADSGFWLVKEYSNLSVRDVMLRFNLCRVTMSLTGFSLLLLWEKFMF